MGESYMRASIESVLMAGIILGAIVSVLVYRYRIKKYLKHILDRVDKAISGETSVVNYDEGIESAIGEKLNQFLISSQGITRQTTNERDIMKSYISDISHQTKTSLTNLMVYAQILKEQPENNVRYKEIADRILSQSEKLDFLIKNLTKASQLELDIMSIHKKQEDIDQLISGACQSIEAQALKCHIDILYQPCKGSCSFDMRWTQEALANILDNAVKYSFPGSVIEICVIPYELFYRIDVSNEGVGIKEEEQGMIFQRFYRSSTVSDKPGLGIGLYLSRQIIMRQDGYIEVCSKENKRTTFSIFLHRN